MPPRSATRLASVAVLTVLFGAAILAMLLAGGAFDPTWFFGALALYGTALLVVWLALHGAPEGPTPGSEKAAAPARRRRS